MTSSTEDPILIPSDGEFHFQFFLICPSNYYILFYNGKREDLFNFRLFKAFLCGQSFRVWF